MGATMVDTSGASEVLEGLDESLRDGDGEFDPFRAPSRLTAIADAWPRRRVAVAGEVIACDAARWAGGTVLEVVLADESGAILLAFFGRHSVPGVTVGSRIMVGGTVIDRRGSRTILNPFVWLATPHGR